MDVLCTQGKHVQGNQEGTADVKKIRTWRQYMNRYAILSPVVRTSFNNRLSSCTDVEASTDHWTRSNDGFMAISTRTSDGQLVECIRCFDHATGLSGYSSFALKTYSTFENDIYIRCSSRRPWPVCLLSCFATVLQSAQRSVLYVCRLIVCLSPVLSCFLQTKESLDW